jgi:hypothetical protein
MVHQAVEVGGAEPPVAEGAPVNASSKVAIVMARLQPPEDVTSLGVEGLVVAVDIAALHLSRSTVGDITPGIPKYPYIYDLYMLYE